MEHKDEMNNTKGLDQLTLKNIETGIDIEPLLEQCMGDIDILNDLITILRGNILEFIGKVKLHLVNKNSKEIECATRKLKYGLLLVKSEELSVIVKEMHVISKNDGDMEQLNYLYDSFVDRYPSIDNAIQRQLESLRERRGKTY